MQTSTFCRTMITGLLHPLQITAALTPDGRADAVKRMPDGQEVFALPAYQSMPFAVFLQAVRMPQGDEIAYAQSQNNRRASATHARHANAQVGRFLAVVALR